MEAKVLQRKKTTLDKGKLKKTIKNVVCSPDSLYWPTLSEEKSQLLQSILDKYKVEIPVYNKPKWKELKLLSKENRPKAPKIEKVEGLLFGIAECSAAVASGECSAIVFEAQINPKTIAQPLIEDCIKTKVPITTLNELRQRSSENFGIKTSCLGIKRNYLEDISDLVLGFHKPYKEKVYLGTNENYRKVSEDIEMSEPEPVVPFSYLHRTSKNTRVFIPPSEETKGIEPVKFIGQAFIKFDKKETTSKKAFMKMKVKRITNNPNRPKSKKQKKGVK